MAIEFAGAVDGELFETDSNGTATVTRKLSFRLSGDDYGKPLNLFGNELLPQKGAAHPNKPYFTATGDKSASMEAGGRVCVVSVKYSAQEGDNNSQKKDAKPWELGFTSYENSVEVISEPLERDIVGCAVESTAGTGIEAVHDVYHHIIRATYSLESFKAAWVKQFKGSVNLTSMPFGKEVMLSAGQWMIRDLSSSHVKTYDDNGKLKWDYYNISITIIGKDAIQMKNKRGKLYTMFNTITGDFYGTWKQASPSSISPFAIILGNRSTFMKGSGGPEPLYQYTPKGRKVVFGTWNDLMADFKDKRDEFERVSDPIWLTVEGEPAPIGQDGMQEQAWLCFQDFIYRDWSALSFPKS